MCICICGYCKYHNELFYKAPICSMVFIWSCCHDVFLLSGSFIVNTATRYVIKLHGKYVLFSVVMLQNIEKENLSKLSNLGRLVD